MHRTNVLFCFLFVSGVARKTRIVDVVYNASNNELVRTKTLVKNCIILVDATPFRRWYENHYAQLLGKKKNQKLTADEEQILNKKRSRSVDKKFKARQKEAKLEPSLEEQMQAGRVLGQYSHFCFQKVHLMRTTIHD